MCVGSSGLTLSELFSAIANGPVDVAGRIFWYARLPRTAACVLAGAALAVSGAVIQGVLANKLASPGIIGVNAGSGLAVTICCAVGALSGWVVAGAAFAGALIAVMTVVLAAQKLRASKTVVVLGGVALNSCLSAASEAITVLVPDAGVQAADFRMGGFSSVAHTRLIPAGIMIIAALAVIFTLLNELEVLSLGEDSAQGLGLPARRMRTILLGLAALLAGSAVSFAGLLGFVGLIVPHMARRIMPGGSNRLIPFCAIGGAALVTLCDLLSRTLFSPHEIPAGIPLAFIGGPLFILLLVKSRREESE